MPLASKPFLLRLISAAWSLTTSNLQAIEALASANNDVCASYDLFANCSLVILSFLVIISSASCWAWSFSVTNFSAFEIFRLFNLAIYSSLLALVKPSSKCCSATKLFCNRLSTISCALAIPWFFNCWTYKSLFASVNWPSASVWVKYSLVSWLNACCISAAVWLPSPITLVKSPNEFKFFHVSSNLAISLISTWPSVIACT